MCAPARLRCPASLASALLAVLLLVPGPARADGAVEWVQPTRGVAIAVDSADNVFTVDFEQALGAELVLTKRDATGALLWRAFHDQTDGTKWERAAWVTADLDDNAIVCGTLMSGYSNPVSAASVVMKFAPDGTVLWRHVYESGFDGSSVRKCLTDDDDNVYVIGLGSGPNGLVTKIKKFAPDGAAVWSWFDAAGIGAPLNAKLTADGGLLVIGRGTVGSVNGYAKVGLDGTTRWSLAGVSSLTAGDAAGDALGHTYVVHGPYLANGLGVVKKLSPAGALLWERGVPLAALRVEVGPDGRPVVSGYPSPSSFGAAFAKLDEAGATLWTNLDADGPLALMMHAQMIVDGAGDAFLAAGTLFEMAVCKVRADGGAAWTLTTTGSYANAIALASDGDVLVVGGATARLGDSAATSQRPPLAVASASPASGTAPLTVYFSSAGSLDPDGGALAYAWSFGDGGSSTAPSGAHVYAAPGTYAATLTVTDPEGLTGSAAVTVTVLPRPLRVTDITLSAARKGSTVTVAGRVTVKDAAGTPVAGAEVNVRWALPRGRSATATALTNASGVATLSTGGARGTYTLTVTDVKKPGHLFDAAGSPVLSRSITR